MTQRRTLAITCGLSIIVVGIALATRPLLPIDETRYTSVAWEMWLRRDFLVPYLNGVPYSHKPPLLFWVMHAGWWVFGVNEVWPRVAPSLFAMASLFLTTRIARLLWPQHGHVARQVPILILATPLWLMFTTLVMFDVLLTCFTLLAIAGVLHAWRHQDARGWVVFGLAIGLGLLSKGVVVLLHVMPVVLLAPWWSWGSWGSWGSSNARPTNWRQWYSAAFLGVLLGASIALAWAIPAALEGGPRYANDIFLRQTVDRVGGGHSFAHSRPFWWYLPLLLLILFPWLTWPPLWRSFRTLLKAPSDAGTRFCIAWLVTVIAGFSVISGKQLHYLLPLIPAFALLVSRTLRAAPRINYRRDALPASLLLGLVGAVFLTVPHLKSAGESLAWVQQAPPWTGIVLLLAAGVLITLPFTNADRGVPPPPPVLAAASMLLVLVAQAGIMPYAASRHDMAPAATFLHDLEKRGYAIAHVGKYEGQFHFTGRLNHPFATMDRSSVLEWTEQHPLNAVIHYTKDLPATMEPDAFYREYRDRFLVVEVTPETAVHVLTEK